LYTYYWTGSKWVEARDTIGGINKALENFTDSVLNGKIEFRADASALTLPANSNLKNTPSAASNDITLATTEYVTRAFANLLNKNEVEFTGKVTLGRGSQMEFVDFNNSDSLVNLSTLNSYCENVRSSLDAAKSNKDHNHTLTSLHMAHINGGTVLKPRTDVLNAYDFLPLVESDIPGLNVSKLTNGTLPVVRGGTGLSISADTARHRLPYITNAATPVTALTNVAAGALFSIGATSAPQFGTLPVAQGGTGATSLKNANIATLSDVDNKTFYVHNVMFRSSYVPSSGIFSVIATLQIYSKDANILTSHGSTAVNKMDSLTSYLFNRQCRSSETMYPACGSIRKLTSSDATLTVVGLFSSDGISIHCVVSSTLGFISTESLGSSSNTSFCNITNLFNN